MSFRKAILFSCLLIGTIGLVLPNFSRAYDDQTTHPTINPKDLEKKKQHEDYELETEVAEEKKKDSGFKKLNLDSLNNFFRNR